MLPIRKILVATRNTGKFKEIATVLSLLPVHLVSLAEEGVLLEVEELSESLAENAIKKVQSYAQATNLWTVADDTGIFFDVLGGQPGTRTRRWPGYEASDEGIIAYALEKLESYPQSSWTCYFQTVAALKIPEKRVEVFVGRLHGVMLKEPRGESLKGLPFMAHFYIPEKGKTAAQLPLEELTRIDHRGQAFQKLRTRLRELLTNERASSD